MTKRTCPWCGGRNLILRNCSGSDPKHQNASYHYWEDSDCGYKEKTTSDEYYDYKKHEFVTCEREIVSVHKTRPPLPPHQQPEYLRSGKIPDKVVEPGQITLDEVPA